MYWVDLVNLIIATAGLSVSVLGLLMVLNNRFADDFTKRFFIIIFILLIMYSGSSLGSNVTLLYPNEPYTALSTAFVFGESFFSSLIMPVLSLFLIWTCGRRTFKHPLFISSCVLWVLYFAMLLFNLKSGLFYYFTNDNIYHRGSLYPILLVPPVLLMLLNVNGLISFRKHLSTKNKAAFTTYFIVPAICMIVQMYFYGILMIVLGSSIAALVMFAIILSDHRAMIRKQETDLLLLQIHPHFIYNTLTHIYYLCDSDPQAAQSVIGSFTTYLRKNFSALSNNDLSTFDEELEHTKAYLSVIKARYNDLINIEYDIKHKDFHLPPLTLEPIVENAVKHGVDPEFETLNIKIISEQKDKVNIVTVINDGPAYKPAEDDGIHVGLNNVKERLELMCGGTLSIEPGDDGAGAVVTIRVPEAF